MPYSIWDEQVCINEDSIVIKNHLGIQAVGGNCYFHLGQLLLLAGFVYEVTWPTRHRMPFGGNHKSPCTGVSTKRSGY